jgi:hypothetical protein
MQIKPSQELIDHGARRAWLSFALAAIVRATDHMPKGSPERHALVQAAEPLRDRLF